MSKPNSESITAKNQTATRKKNKDNLCFPKFSKRFTFSPLKKCVQRKVTTTLLLLVVVAAVMMVREGFRGNAERIECRPRAEPAFDYGNNDVVSRQWTAFTIHNPRYLVQQSPHFFTPNPSSPIPIPFPLISKVKTNSPPTIKKKKKPKPKQFVPVFLQTDVKGKEKKK